MSTVLILIKRNIKLFFKDKGMFLTSLITPLILLVLYATFLRSVFRNSFLSSVPKGIRIPDEILDGLVSGQLVSSLLAVSCVTVAFCSNFLMVQDKVTGALKDLRISPVKSSVLSISYYIASLLSTLLICFSALGICFVYLAVTGWYLSPADVMLLILDVFLLVLFGTALSSVINFFLSTQGQISAVGTIISAGYGFICGAYMPISNFSSGLQKVISFLPGTYGTVLVRRHSMQGAFAEMAEAGIPAEKIKSFKEGTDCILYFFGNPVSEPVMYLILAGTITVLVTVYVLLNRIKKEY